MNNNSKEINSTQSVLDADDSSQPTSNDYIRGNPINNSTANDNKANSPLNKNNISGHINQSIENSIIIVDHPIIVDGLSHLRDKNTDIDMYRYYSDRICSLIFSQSISDIDMVDSTIYTPIEITNVKKIDSDIIILPVLRSGIAMLFGAMNLLPKAKVGFIGLERNEITAVASQYYCKFPTFHDQSHIIITDPMLATGGSILHLLHKVAEQPHCDIRIVSVIASMQGIQLIHKEFPQVKIFVASIDRELNDKKQIVPGLGDYGDRYFGTN